MRKFKPVVAKAAKKAVCVVDGDLFVSVSGAALTGETVVDTGSLCDSLEHKQDIKCQNSDSKNGCEKDRFRLSFQKFVPSLTM